MRDKFKRLLKYNLTKAALLITEERKLSKGEIRRYVYLRVDAWDITTVKDIKKERDVRDVLGSLVISQRVQSVTHLFL